MNLRTIVCIASGFSLTQADVDHCRGKARVMVVSDNYKKAPWADWMYSADMRWWQQNPNVPFAGEKWTLDDRALSPGYADHLIRHRPGNGLSLDPQYVNWGGTELTGGNSGAQSVGMAFHKLPIPKRGSRIALLGYTMRGPHWFGDHLNIANPGDLEFRAWIAAFRELNADLAAQGVELINCTPESALDFGPIRNIREVLQ